MTTTLHDLAEMLEEHQITVKTSPEILSESIISGCSSDSRFTRAQDIFACKGRRFKPSYLEDALEKGAVAYLCSPEASRQLEEAFPGTPHLVVERLRPAMAYVSAQAFGWPNHHMECIGITGTKGKSSTSYMLRSIVDTWFALNGQPAKAAIIGSIETYDGIECMESTNTTPEAPDLWRHLANAADSNTSPCIMEISSQALKYDRVLGLPFDICCFLNIGKDHISPIEHPDFEDYFSSKLKIFSQSKRAVVNLDSGHIHEILEAAQVCQQVFTCSSEGKDADFKATHISSHRGKVRFLCHTPEASFPVSLAMPGLFNVDNALAAIAMAQMLGIGQDAIQQGLAAAKVPGRMELIESPDSRMTGLVDYAHNQLSYEKFFQSAVQEFPGSKIIVVMSAPGDKAFERRKELPREAARWAEHMIYTEEDPAHESVEAICQEMAEHTPSDASFEIICNRPEAIFRAVQLAYEQEQPTLICVLAKGDETLQHRGDVFEPMEPDGQVLRRAFQQYCQ